MSNDEVTERAVEMLRQAMASGAVAFVEKVRAHHGRRVTRHTECKETP